MAVRSHQMIKLHFLVGGFNPFENYDSQFGFLLPIYRKMKFMFQTTTQLFVSDKPHLLRHWISVWLSGLSGALHFVFLLHWSLPTISILILHMYISLYISMTLFVILYIYTYILHVHLFVGRNLF